MSNSGSETARIANRVIRSSANVKGMQPQEPSLREYESVMDLVRNTSTIVGAEDFYGQATHDHVVGPQDWLGSVHPDDVDLMVDALDRIAQLKPGESHAYSLRFHHVDGGYVRSEYVTTPLEYGENGLVTKAKSHVRWVAFED